MDEDPDATWARLRMRAWGLFVLIVLFAGPGLAILWATSLLD